MKNIHFYILSLLVLTSCNSSISIFNEELKGNGNIISKNIDVDKIIAIENNGIFNVIIT